MQLFPYNSTFITTLSVLIMPLFKSVIFDLDGVITKTASVHAAAWKEMFDEFLYKREAKDNEAFSEFTKHDYLTFVDGKPRHKGIESFLKSRNIDLPFRSENP